MALCALHQHSPLFIHLIKSYILVPGPRAQAHGNHVTHGPQQQSLRCCMQSCTASLCCWPCTASPQPRPVLHGGIMPTGKTCAADVWGKALALRHAALSWILLRKQSQLC